MSVYTDRNRVMQERDALRVEIERLTKERDFARDAVGRKWWQYDRDMITMRDALTREIVERYRLQAENEKLRQEADRLLATMDQYKARAAIVGKDERPISDYYNTWGNIHAERKS